MTLCGRSKKGEERGKERREGSKGGRRGEEKEKEGEDVIHVGGLFDTHLPGCIVPWHDEFWQMYHWGSFEGER